MFLSCHRPKSNGSSQLWTETVSQNNVVLQYFLGDGKLIKTFLTAARACPRNLTGGNRRCQKRQETEDQTCTKLGPGRLGAWMETHQPPPPPVSLLYTVAKQGGEVILRGGEQDTVILRNRRNL
jgi:hypothetical protein